MGIPEYLSVKLKTTTCYREGCHALIILPHDSMLDLMQSREVFYCWRGHAQHFTGKTDAERAIEERNAARDERDRAKREVEYYRARADKMERSRAAYKGRVTRIKKRIGNGVCPCCNRTFSNLGRHMASQHPGYQDSDL